MIKRKKKGVKTKNRRFIPLNLKFSVVVICAFVIAALVITLATAVESTVAEKEYKSPAAVEKNIGSEYSSLVKYIEENNVKGTDVDDLQKWLKKHEYTYLYVYDNFKSTFDGGWQMSNEKQTKSDGLRRNKTPDQQRKNIEKDIDVENAENQQEESERITPDLFKADTQNRILNFQDGSYYVYMNVYKQQHWYSIMFIVKVLLAVISFFSILFIYNGNILSRIINLSSEVHHISDGDLDCQITQGANDEIGRLSMSVDIMRDSILEKLKNEKEAWDANTQLITAMSHDIRTPLTSLIGYLDIIQGGKYNSEEELQKYIESCRNKAFQLKDLSDKLFQYFLVFGSHDGDRNMEIFDADILLPQIIYEHVAELITNDYQVDFDFDLQESKIQVDLSAVQRLFDNLFSNIMKYADKRYHISITAVCENDRIVIRLFNRILESSRKVESNHIGLKTCEKICVDMGGTFNAGEREQLFAVRISLPVEKASEEEKTASEEA